MTKLEYTFKTDTLFKMLFTKHQHLLERLVAELLGIKYESIEQFNITNPEIQPENFGDKFCRLDINMTVNGQRVDLEIQVRDEKNYRERSLFMWARSYSSALGKGKNYRILPRTIIISILGFPLFDDPNKWHSEFQLLEVTTHEPLTDKCVLHYFELPKLTGDASADNTKELWLKLFKADTEEDLERIDGLGVPIMSEAIQAYRSIATSPDFREIERLRMRARHDETSALDHAEQLGIERGAEMEREKWQVLVSEKDTELEEKAAALEEKDAALEEKDSLIAELLSRLESRRQ